MGGRRNVAETTLERPLGSGPYRIGGFEAGQRIEYERVEDYWGEDLNVTVGQNNFVALRFNYFRDMGVLFEAFTADALDWWVENTARRWATGCDFPAVRDKRVVLEEFPIRNVGVMQAFAFNTRLAKLKDPRLRRAFNFALNFEAINRDIFYGEYTRIASYFQGTDLACSGLPHGRELELLKSIAMSSPPKCSHEDGGGNGLHRQRPSLQSALPSDVQPLPGRANRMRAVVRTGEGAGREPSGTAA
jgi:microcin C transport system substrate-binding protein